MIEKSLGFIGGGRITRIILEGFRRKEISFEKISVFDINPDVLIPLKEKFPDIATAPDSQLPSSCDIVFIALHPPAVLAVLDEIKSSIKQNGVIISLAPKITISKMAEKLGGFSRIVRMIPNACSIINHGYNPVAFSPSLNEEEKKELLRILAVLGDCPEIGESKLEAYAIVAAMGPTYLWFQLYELEKIAESFGLTSQEARGAVSWMVEGSAKTMNESGLMPEEVIDLIPVKPLGEEEEKIKSIYHAKLEALFDKLKS